MMYLGKKGTTKSHVPSECGSKTEPPLAHFTEDLHGLVKFIVKYTNYPIAKSRLVRLLLNPDGLEMMSLDKYASLNGWDKSLTSSPMCCSMTGIRKSLRKLARKTFHPFHSRRRKAIWSEASVEATRKRTVRNASQSPLPACTMAKDFVRPVLVIGYSREPLPGSDGWKPSDSESGGTNSAGSNSVAGISPWDERFWKSNIGNLEQLVFQADCYLSSLNLSFEECLSTGDLEDVTEMLRSAEFSRARTDRKTAMSFAEEIVLYAQVLRRYWLSTDTGSTPSVEQKGPFGAIDGLAGNGREKPAKVMASTNIKIGRGSLSNFREISPSLPTLRAVSEIIRRNNLANETGNTTLDNINERGEFPAVYSGVDTSLEVPIGLKYRIKLNTAAKVTEDSFSAGDKKIGSIGEINAPELDSGLDNSPELLPAFKYRIKLNQALKFTPEDESPSAEEENSGGINKIPEVDSGVDSSPEVPRDKQRPMKCLGKALLSDIINAPGQQSPKGEIQHDFFEPDRWRTLKLRESAVNKCCNGSGNRKLAKFDLSPFNNLLRVDHREDAGTWV